VIHPDEMKVTLIVGDEKPGKIPGALIEDFQDGVGGFMGERRMGLAVAFGDVGDLETPHAAASSR
jgi:hypothetical protein